MNSMSRIIVDDAHISAGKTLQEMCALLDTEIAEYIKILDQVTTEAAKSGLTTARYQEYASIVSGLQGQFRRLGDMLNVTTTQFVSDVDTADRYLY